MKQWTTQAEQRLAEYLRDRSAREGLDGEDAAELKDDLRSHIHEETERLDGETIGLMQMEHIIGRLEAGERSENGSEMERMKRLIAATSPSARPVGSPEIERSASSAAAFQRFFLWTFGVVFPLGVLVFELLVSFCGSVFFDPVPTWWHAVLVAMVPLVNAWLLTGGRCARTKLKAAAAGWVLVTSLFYGLLFLVIVHLSVIAIIFFGLGMISLTPVLAAITTWRIGRRARRESNEPAEFKSGWRMGVAAGILALCLLEALPLWTRANLTIAMSGEAGAPAAVERLRALGSERVLLKACYEGNRGTVMATDISGWISSGWMIPAAMIDEAPARTLDSEKARDVFFRVTGRPFNTLKPPSSSRGGPLGRSGAMNEVDFDDHIGGDAVAVRLRNLDLAESRFDGHVDTVSRIGYGEWTMVFRNRSPRDQEARCQVRLPRDGRVSRLTLWVKGEPREAAFSTVSKVKAAYKSVAVVQHRDPVLVNVVGPDTVMVQCFPVPAHGEMKIRFGVTAPLDGQRWELPRIVERNFGTADTLEHAVWMQGDQGFDLTGVDGEPAAHRDGEGYSVSSAVRGASALDGMPAVRTGLLPAEPPVVWCEDRFAKPEKRILIREPVRRTCPVKGRPVLVIDGSASMAAAKEWILKSVGGMPPGHLELLLADDQARRVTPDDIKSFHFTGGRDNEPALREGIRLSRETGGPVVWIHGPQAVAVSQSEALLQLLERGAVRPDIIEVEAAAGPNRLAEAIYQTGCLHRGPALLKPEADFARFLGELAVEREETAWTWKRAAAPDGLAGTKVWDHLARSWAAAIVEDKALSMSDAARAELAARYQMVTPFSGAVVLETQEQYDENGLVPADGDATPKIPNIPEPSVSLLVLVSAAASLMARKRPQ